MTSNVSADGETGLLEAAALFRGLADVNRQMILRALLDGELRVVDVTRLLGLAQSTVSAHLTCLRECGLVESRPVGRASVFRATLPEELGDVLAAAQRLSDRTRGSLAGCATYGRGA